MHSRKEAIRARLTKKVQAKRRQECEAASGFFHNDVLVSTINIQLPVSNSRRFRLKRPQSDGRCVISSEVVGSETGKIAELLDGIDVCRKAYNQEENSTTRLVLECAFRIMESHLLSYQLGNGDVILDPAYPLEDYLSLAKCLSIHRHMLCTFANKQVKGDIPEVKDDDGVEKVQDLILHELVICTRIHEMIDEDGPVPFLRQALEWCARWNVIFKRMNCAVIVRKALDLELLHDDPAGRMSEEPFGKLPILTSVRYEDALTVEGFFANWAHKARFPMTTSKNNFDVEGARKFMRKRWEQFIDSDDDST